MSAPEYASRHSLLHLTRPYSTHSSLDLQTFKISTDPSYARRLSSMRSVGATVDADVRKFTFEFCGALYYAVRTQRDLPQQCLQYPSFTAFHPRRRP